MVDLVDISILGQPCLDRRGFNRNMGVSINGGTPKMDGLQWKILLKLMIWGYPHFRKPSYLLRNAATCSFLIQD